MQYLRPLETRRKRHSLQRMENIKIQDGHISIRRWSVDAQLNLIYLETLRHG